MDKNTVISTNIKPSTIAIPSSNNPYLSDILRPSPILTGHVQVMTR